MFRKWIIIFMILLGPALAFGSTIDVYDADIQPGDHVVWASDNTYVLHGFVFVDSTATLTIEPGTIIKGSPGQGANASALIVARGAKIFAEGTVDRPIIFTALADDVTDPNDLPLDARGLWGGVILLGRARINTAARVGQIEGIPSTEPRGAYGGTDDNDTSGVMKYVSIRYGGTDISAGNEINGLTFGAVGRGTVIDYIEVLNNKDDGYEWFGGTVQTKHLISAFNADDGFDYDEGFRGKGQFWFVIQSDVLGNRMGEHDGGTVPEDGTPYAIPEIYNATYIGSGKTSGNAANDHGIIMRDNAGGKYYNSLFTDFAGDALNIEDLTSGEDSRARLAAGDIVYQNDVWFGFGAGDAADQLFPQAFVRTAITATANNNRFVDPQLKGISRTNDGNLDPRPKAGSPLWTDYTTVPNDGFFTPVNYVGAFGSDNWAEGWTALSQLGFLKKTVTVVEENNPSETAPNTFELKQNYPNPFNPITQISFSLPVKAQVELAVFNLMGQKVAVLVHEVRNPGTYTIQWNAASRPSGVYVYQLMAGRHQVTRKMTLMR
ncbi:MAG: T9SS type A sorting domain-containing protein [Calditrichaeota bacterium]|nr:T9SS type A sorting domain-containing protein [Calditrichota bacterium]